MSKVPKIKLAGSNAFTATLNRTGSMTNSYSPFKNLSNHLNNNLGDFTTGLLNFDLEHPVDILIQDSYDGSVNLVLNDGKNLPRLIGSRFSVVDDGKFKITDHSGMKDTNIYDEKTFDIDTSLKAIVLKIPQIKYKGLSQFGGSLPVGSYTFYFKLADADGNESEVIAESGIVLLFISGLKAGVHTSHDIPDPTSIRMGLEDENSGKSVSFKLTNIDSGFDYVHVLYAKSSSGNEQAATDTYHKIIFDYPIFDGEANITITGKEIILDISANELYIDYADIESVKTQTVVNNVLFFGNTQKKERDWEALRKASWKILPSYNTKPNIGSIDYKYTCGSEGLIPEEEYTGCYYNTFNTYYRVGYWPDEIYQFGIVYIFNDNSLSPVFSLLGVDFSLLKNITEKELFCKQIDPNDDTVIGYQEWEYEPDDCYFNKQYRLNSRGVIKFPKVDVFKNCGGGRIRPCPLYILFDLSHIGIDAITITKNELTEKDTLTEHGSSPLEFFKLQDIKGYFFVRRTRIPTILAQGLAIGLTDKDRGALPVITNNGAYSAQSFLGENGLLNQIGNNITVSSPVSINAALVPDAELSEATFNQLFVSNKYTLIPANKYSFDDFQDQNNCHTSIASKVNFLEENSEPTVKRKLTVVLDGVKTLTDGEVYFSTMSGDPSDPIKTKDVDKIWNKTNPLELTTSKSIVRGNWGPFVGIGEREQTTDPDLKYGIVYNIKQENYYSASIDTVVDLEFLKRFNDASAYKAICHRTELNEESIKIDCYRGDCFLSLFTHRMFRNFIDPELPTNDKIINPRCWADNYAVRTTCTPNATSIGNLNKENEGWNIPDSDMYANEVATAFEVKEIPSDDSSIKWDAPTQQWLDKLGYPARPPVAMLDVKYYITAPNAINKIDSSSQETSGIGGVIKNIFKSDRWTMRGVTSINRADVNAVALGEWITFPICSSKNLALRDIDFSNATEEAAFNRKRSFYPLSPKDPHCPLRDSNVINQAASISLPHKSYYLMPNVPFIKLEYFTRIINSLRDSAASITNEFKVMLENAYRDYTKIYGPITKIMALGSNMLVIFHHGIGVLSISDTMSQAKDASQYLPIELNLILSPSFGSMWKDSIIESQGYIYGVDTVAKVIWRVSSEPKLELLSPMKVEKFLIDSIDLSEFTNTPYVGRVNVKTHYNAFKHDVMFTYYNDILYKMSKAYITKLDESESNESESDEDETVYYTYSDSGISISEFKIDSQGYLLDEFGIRLKSSAKEDLEPGIKIVASYNNETGKIERYTDKIEQESDKHLFKWATGKSWSLCFNEQTNSFVTFYDWIPLESENIDNMWFSFDREAANELVEKGIKNELEHLISPINASYRDKNYGRYLMDPAFNTSIPITYIKNNLLLDFGPINIVYQNSKNNSEECKSTVIGFYIKGNDNTDLDYTINLNLSNVQNTSFTSTNFKELLVKKDVSWTFVAIVFPLNNLSINPNLSIKINTTGNYYGAVSDLIVKTFNLKENEHFINTYADNSNINIYFPFTNSTADDFYPVRDLGTNLKLWKHGFAGIYDNEDVIRPTYWYGKQHEFNFEFIARKDAMHKIFDNLQLISNKAEPNKFEIEVVGEVYEWNNLKPVLKWISDQVDVPTSHDKYDEKLNYWFTYVLSTDYSELCKDSTFPRIFGMKPTDRFKKLPYLRVTDAVVPSLDPLIIGDKSGEKDSPNVYLKPEDQGRGKAHSDNTVTTALVYDSQLNEYRVHTEQLGNNIKKYGRLRGNMQYLEDLWKVEIRPIAFRWAYKENEELKFSRIAETRPRDKYCKIKVRYSGEDLALIQSIATIFDYSYA